MIGIGEITDLYVLDLNLSDEQDEYVLDVLSEENGLHCSWGIDTIVGSRYLNVSTSGRDKLEISVNLDKFKKKGLIILKNVIGEKLRIIVLPNLEATREKNYVFKLGKTSVSGKTMTINVISKENGKNIPWEITYDGKPISYDISKLKTKFSVTLTSIPYSELTSLFELTQDKSNKKITIKLFHKDADSIEILEEKTD
jgi:hypothetical protein